MLRPRRSLRASSGATLASICCHGMRVASTASGWRRSIIWSSRARKKSGVLIEIPLQTPRNSHRADSSSGVPTPQHHLTNSVSMRLQGVLQGRRIENQGGGRELLLRGALRPRGLRPHAHPRPLGVHLPLAGEVTHRVAPVRLSRLDRPVVSPGCARGPGPRLRGAWPEPCQVHDALPAPPHGARSPGPVPRARQLVRSPRRPAPARS